MRVISLKCSFLNWNREWWMQVKEGTTLCGRSTQKIDSLFCRIDFNNQLFYGIFWKSSLMYQSSWDRGHFMKNFCFDTIIICNITREPHSRTVQWFKIVPMGSQVSLQIKYHRLLSKVIKVKSISGNCVSPS